MKVGTRITICAFTDNAPNSIAYRKFDDINKAIAFYKKMLEKDNVNVISTRKVERSSFFWDSKKGK